MSELMLFYTRNAIVWYISEMREHGTDMYINEENTWLSTHHDLQSQLSASQVIPRECTPCKRSPYCINHPRNQKMFPTKTIFEVRSYLTLLRLLVALAPKSHIRDKHDRARGAPSSNKRGRCPLLLFGHPICCTYIIIVLQYNS